MALMATVFTRRAAQHVFFINDASFTMSLLHRRSRHVLAQSEMATIPVVKSRGKTDNMGP